MATARLLGEPGRRMVGRSREARRLWLVGALGVLVPFTLGATSWSRRPTTRADGPVAAGLVEVCPQPGNHPISRLIVSRAAR
jgi:hypothetical protein